MITVDEPVHKKTNNLGFRPGPTRTGLYGHRRWLEAGNFGCRKKRNCTICVAKTKALISFAVTAKLICGFVFACADCWFSHAVAQMITVYCVFELKYLWLHCFTFDTHKLAPKFNPRMHRNDSFLIRMKSLISQ